MAFVNKLLLVAARVQEGEEASIFVPVRPIVDNLGMSWPGQFERIQRDPILSEATKGVRVTRTPEEGGAQEMISLPLKFIPGFLFGINANRVKEGLRDRVLRYQRECYDVLWEAFQEGRLTADEDFELLLKRADPGMVQAYQMARAIVRLARQQIIMETRITGRLDDHERRLEDIESTLGDPDRVITPAQAMHLSQAVKAIAYKLSERSNRNEFGGVWGEFYRRFEVSTYRELPAAKFDEAMAWLKEWWGQLTGSDEIPF